MSWSQLPPGLRALAEDVCTSKELDALKLYEPQRVGYRSVAVLLGISVSTARDRINRALAKIGRALEEAGRQP